MSPEENEIEWLVERLKDARNEVKEAYVRVKENHSAQLRLANSLGTIDTILAYYQPENGSEPLETQDIRPVRREKTNWLRRNILGG